MQVEFAYTTTPVASVSQGLIVGRLAVEKISLIVWDTTPVVMLA